MTAKQTKEMIRILFEIYDSGVKNETISLSDKSKEIEQLLK